MGCVVIVILIVWQLLVLVIMATFYIRIQNRTENRPFNSFWKDVAMHLVSTGGKSFSFLPIFMLPSTNDTNDLKQLKVMRNIWVVIFWICMALIFLIGFIYGENPYAKSL